jgi:hypothetical protein
MCIGYMAKYYTIFYRRPEYKGFWYLGVCVWGDVPRTNWEMALYVSKNTQLNLAEVEYSYVLKCPCQIRNHSVIK